jgi:hypothetical protein
MRRYRMGILLCVVGLGTLALDARKLHAQLEELFSRHVRVFHPTGEFAPRLIRHAPPSGPGWRQVEDAKSGYRIMIPATAQADTASTGSRVLQVPLSDAAARPRPVLRIDVFEPQPGDPTAVDADYAARYAEEYPEAAFGGKFTVTDNGLVALPKKLNLAMVGGTYLQGAASAVRFQFAYLGKERQLFLTFDCAEKDWSQHSDLLAQILLSFEMPHRRGK